MTRQQQLQLSSQKKKGQPDTADDAAPPKLKKKRSKRRVRKAGSRDAVDKSGCEAAATAKPKPSKPKAMASKPKAAAAKAKPAAKKAAKAKATRKPVKSASSSWVDPEESESGPSAKASKRPSALARKASKRQVLKRAKALRASKSFETEAHCESGEEEEPEHNEDANPENAVEAEPAGEEGNHLRTTLHAYHPLLHRRMAGLEVCLQRAREDVHYGAQQDGGQWLCTCMLTSIVARHVYDFLRMSSGGTSARSSSSVENPSRMMMDGTMWQFVPPGSS